MSEQSGEIVVIGAGIGGLAAATRLAKAGLKLEFLKPVHNQAENVEP